MTENASELSQQIPPTLDVVEVTPPPPPQNDGQGDGTVKHHHFRLRWSHDDRSTCRAYQVRLEHLSGDRKVLASHGPVVFPRNSFPADGRLEHVFTGLARGLNGHIWRCEIRGHYDPVDEPVSGVPVEPRLADEIAWVYEWPAQLTRGGQRPLRPTQVVRPRRELVGA